MLLSDDSEQCQIFSSMRFLFFILIFIIHIYSHQGFCFLFVFVFKASVNFARNVLFIPFLSRDEKVDLSKDMHIY